MKEPNNRSKIQIKQCSPADSQRTINDPHVDKLVEAYKHHHFALFNEVLVVMKSPDNSNSYLIFDGQHRWSAMNKVLNEKTSSQFQSPSSNNCLIEAIVFPSSLTFEEQRMISNGSDNQTTLHLPFSDVDLVLLH